ncbi:hypothetical protein NP493_648g00006 [Ridgeia piscesae]|uniref:Uncharacterized protein n=1 Tax=Ridgeia piscesae TaxID=27915 RepID=A0AAD9NRC9_RIDPI|nr:hypothetical protein NP493_648g00006 [Ridgeia piscesae]
MFMALAATIHYTVMRLQGHRTWMTLRGASDCTRGLVNVLFQTSCLCPFTYIRTQHCHPI